MHETLLNPPFNALFSASEGLFKFPFDRDYTCFWRTVMNLNRLEECKVFGIYFLNPQIIETSAGLNVQVVTWFITEHSIKMTLKSCLIIISL